MTTAEFNKLVNDQTERSRQTLARKATEYARGDRLSNFKRAAEAMRCSPERACIGFWMKHVVSLLDMVDDIQHGWTEPEASLALWDEKIDDSINYLILLKGLVHERHAMTAHRK